MKYILIAMICLGTSTWYLKNSQSYVTQKFSEGFQDYSTVLRIYMMDEAILQYKAKPILGWGTQNFQDIMSDDSLNRTEEQKQRLPEIVIYDHSHSNLWELLRSYGGVGLFVYCLFYAFVFIKFYKEYFREKQNIFLIPILSMLVFELYGLTDAAFYMRIPKSFISILVGIFLAYSCSKNEKNTEE